MSERLPQALDGLRVLSLGAFVAGNTAGLLLAELGADLVKIEARERPEVLRTPAYAIGPAVTDPFGVPQTVMYGTLSRGARSLSLDLRNEQARPTFLQLARRADVLIENFAGPSLARWGCGFDDVTAGNPGLVWLSLSGYGRDGPRANYLAYATNTSGYMGLTSLSGYPHGMFPDYVTATTGVAAVLGALAEVQRTGRGAYLDVAQIDAMTQLMTPVLLDPLVNGTEEPWVDNVVPGSWLSGVYRALGRDAWVAVELEDAGDWSALCRFLHRPELDTDDAAVAGGHREVLDEALAAWVGERSAHTAAHLLQKVGLAAGPVQDSEDIWRDPQLRSRGFAVDLPNPDYGPLHYPDSVFRLSRSPGRIERSGPRLGQHTYDILRDWIGSGEDELASLTASGAIYQAPDEADAEIQVDRRGGSPEVAGP